MLYGEKLQPWAVDAFLAFGNVSVIHHLGLPLKNNHNVASLKKNCEKVVTTLAAIYGNVNLQVL